MGGSGHGGLGRCYIGAEHRRGDVDGALYLTDDGKAASMVAATGPRRVVRVLAEPETVRFPSGPPFLSIETFFVAQSPPRQRAGFRLRGVHSFGGGLLSLDFLGVRFGRAEGNRPGMETAEMWRGGGFRCLVALVSRRSPVSKRKRPGQQASKAQTGPRGAALRLCCARPAAARSECQDSDPHRRDHEDGHCARDAWRGHRRNLRVKQPG